MKKHFSGIFIAFYLLISVGCNNTELTGTSTLSDASKTWILPSWGGISIDFVDSSNVKKTFKFSQVVDNPNELQTYDCQKIFFGSRCYQFQTQSISLIGKWVADDKKDSLVMQYSLVQTDVPNNITDIFTVQLADAGNESVDMIRILNPPVSDSLQTFSHYKDSLTFGNTTYKDVYYYEETTTTPPMSVYYTKTNGIVAFKLNGRTWYK